MEGGTEYIRVRALDTDTARLLDAALDAVSWGTTCGIILDLRGNPGGLVAAAVSVGSRFVDDGVVLRTTDRLSGEKLYWSKGNSFPNVALAVLVDEWTSSGAEIVAAAIRDTGSGVLIGQSTYGVGTFQQLIDFSDGSALRITVGEFSTPNGDQIQGVGLVPSVWVNDDWTGSDDPYIAAALTWIQSSQE
jgi:carboxyl-terminal processing protease